MVSEIRNCYLSSFLFALWPSHPSDFYLIMLQYCAKVLSHPLVIYILLPQRCSSFLKLDYKETDSTNFSLIFLLINPESNLKYFSPHTRSSIRSHLILKILYNCMVLWLGLLCGIVGSLPWGKSCFNINKTELN